jgi:adenine-specific DNA methylase
MNKQLEDKEMKKSVFCSRLDYVKLNGKWDWSSKTVKKVIPLQYNDVGDFSEEYVRVRLSEQERFIEQEKYLTGNE